MRHKIREHFVYCTLHWVWFGYSLVRMRKYVLHHSRDSTSCVALHVTAVISLAAGAAAAAGSHVVSVTAARWFWCSAHR